MRFTQFGAPVPLDRPTGVAHSTARLVLVCGAMEELAC